MGRQREWGRHLQKQGALAGHAVGEDTEALATLWWCVRTTASTELAGQECEPGHAGVQGKASQDEVNWEKDSGGHMVCVLSFYRQVFTHKAEGNHLFRNRMTLSLIPVLAAVFHLVCPPRSLQFGL